MNENLIVNDIHNLAKVLISIVSKSSCINSFKDSCNLLASITFRGRSTIKVNNTTGSIISHSNDSIFYLVFNYKSDKAGLYETEIKVEFVEDMGRIDISYYDVSSKEPINFDQYKLSNGSLITIDLNNADLRTSIKRLIHYEL